MLARIRQMIPQAAITSDFIVGFCGETEDDFQQTVELVRQGRFKNSFIFKYSERPGTKAADRFADDVPYEVKQRRNNEMLALQNTISQEDNRTFIGRDVEVLVEGPSKLGAKQDPDLPTLQLMGRTHCDRIVVFDGPLTLVGRIFSVRIEDATPHTLIGTPAEHPVSLHPRSH
jgi:tRNA-2-methylthio-N6-dimethylallyladenosine synthase